MLSPIIVKIATKIPDKVLIKLTNKLASHYIKKYATINMEGYENVDGNGKPIIFICNHLSNADGLILSRVLKERFDPYFVAGVKLSDDPITSIGSRLVKTIPIKPNSADKDAITKMVKYTKEGNNLFIFPEGTRSRTRSMIEAKKGILLIARLTKATIIPIGISGTDILLPISEEGNMGGETWNSADVSIKFGKAVQIPNRDKEEDKQEYDDKCMNIIMGSIASLLPESYRGVYK